MLVKKRRLGFTALLVAVTLLLGGCSQFSSNKALSEEQRAALEQRVAARWQTIIARDFESTWEFASPAYRDLFPKQLFVRNFSYTVDWQLTGVEVLNYDADAAVASVAVRVMSKSTKRTAVSSKFGALPSTIRENWVFIDGQWWHSANA